MRLDKHIAYRFLNDAQIWEQIIRMIKPNVTDGEITDSKIESMRYFLSNEENKSYYITDTVTDKLKLLKIKTKDGRYDYTVFNELADQKCTFILKDNRLVRMTIDAEVMWFCYLTMSPDNYLETTFFYIKRATGKETADSEAVAEIEDYLYKLLCFIFLSETEEILLYPNQSYGTRKQGKVLNEIKQPLIIVNSNWNVTSIRTEGFNVSGHFRLQPYGQNRGMSRVKWIEPFEKSGYKKTSAKEKQL